MTNIEDAHAPYALASIAWSGVKWHYPRIEKMVDELRRLRQIEAAARAAGQITRDGKFARIGMKVWHPKHGVIGGIVEIYGDSTVAAFRLGVWDGFGERPEGWNDYLVCDCYSTPEAAQAAKEEDR